MGIVFYLEFGNFDVLDKQLIFVFYCYKLQFDSWDEKGFNWFFKFCWDVGSGIFDISIE